MTARVILCFNTRRDLDTTFVSLGIFKPDHAVQCETPVMVSNMCGVRLAVTAVGFPSLTPDKPARSNEHHSLKLLIKTVVLLFCLTFTLVCSCLLLFP